MLKRAVFIMMLLPTVTLIGCTDSKDSSNTTKIASVPDTGITFSPTLNVGPGKAASTPEKPIVSNESKSENANITNETSAKNMKTEQEENEIPEEEYPVVLPVNPSVPLKPRYVNTKSTTMPSKIDLDQSKAQSSNNNPLINEEITELIETQRLIKQAQSRGYQVTIDEGKVVVNDEPIIIVDDEGDYHIYDPNAVFQKSLLKQNVKQSEDKR
ncbi:hypothetical protein [Brevibacillus reuszeri]|uniref:hypothetical protein n=1 Tax=Brevibacillus reuszeri TaxID=54915 RepID=UPI003D24BBB1